MQPKILVLCDPEEDYARQMAVFLEKDRNFPWQVVVCTEFEELEQILKDVKAEVVVLAESLLEQKSPIYSVGQVVILNESGHIRFSEYKNINKYQEAEEVRKELLKLFADQSVQDYPILSKNKSVKCIAFYSPIRRCLQTSTAIAYGQLLAEKNRVLYLNLEFYASVPDLLEGGNNKDMTTLLYHIDSGEEELALQVRMIRRTEGEWDYIPPVRNSENIPIVKPSDWMKLLGCLKGMGEYQYIILDLQDGMQGLFELLRQCDRVYSIVKNDDISREKLQNYQNILRKRGYENILQRTIMLQLPMITHLPDKLEDYSRGELADYVKRKLIMEDAYGICGKEKTSAE